MHKWMKKFYLIVAIGSISCSNSNSETVLLKCPQLNVKIEFEKGLLERLSYNDTLISEGEYKEFFREYINYKLDPKIACERDGARIFLNAIEKENGKKTELVVFLHSQQKPKISINVQD